MTFQIEMQPKEFTRVAKLCASVFVRTPHPILEHAKFTAADGKLTIEATNLDQMMHLSVPCDARGEFTAPISRLVAISYVLSSDPVVIAAGGGTVTVSQVSAKHKMPTLDVRTFPQHEAQKWTISATCDARSLRTGITDLTQYSDSGKLARRYIEGIHFNAKSRVLEATDGKILGRNSAPWLDGNKGFVIPLNAVKPISSALADADEAKISANEIWARFECGDHAILTRLMDNSYPDTDRIIPQTAPHRWRVSVKALELALARVMTIEQEGVGGTTIKAEFGANSLRLSAAKDSNIGEAECACEQLSGDPRTILISSQSTRTILSTMDTVPDIEIGVQDDGGLALSVTPAGADDPYRLMMPMRA